MIYIIDDFVNKELFKVLKDNATGFIKQDITDKLGSTHTFWVKPASKAFITLMENKLSKIEGGQVFNILGFFRESHKDRDNQWNIHNDAAIGEHIPDRAIVFHIKCPKEKGLSGTALWEHVKHGDIYKDKNVKDKKEFDRLTGDRNIKSKWTLKSVIGARPNRLFSYPSHYFHSKYPGKFSGQRVVFVMFYKVIKDVE